MMRYLGVFAMATPFLVAVAAEPASAQKTGGILKMYSPDSPASMLDRRLARSGHVSPLPLGNLTQVGASVPNGHDAGS